MALTKTRQLTICAMIVLKLNACHVVIPGHAFAGPLTSFWSPRPFLTNSLPFKFYLCFLSLSRRRQFASKRWAWWVYVSLSEFVTTFVKKRCKYFFWKYFGVCASVKTVFVLSELNICEKNNLFVCIFWNVAKITGSAVSEREVNGFLYS